MLVSSIVNLLVSTQDTSNTYKNSIIGVDFYKIKSIEFYSL